MATSDPTTNLCIAHLNINGLRNKIDDINHILTLHQIHVLALSETKISDIVQDDKLGIRGYNLYRTDRVGPGGGVALYIDEQITQEKYTELRSAHAEMIWVEIHLPDDKPVLVGCCYVSPRSKTEDLDKVVKAEIFREEKDIFLLGDFNIDWLDKKSVSKKKKLLNTGLTQLVQYPTRVMIEKDGRITSSCIDHIYTNVPGLCSNLTSTATGGSDHIVVGVTVKRRAMELNPNVARHVAPSLSGSFIEQRKDKRCSFSFQDVDAETIKSEMLSLREDISAGTDDLYQRLLETSVKHLLDKCLKDGVFPFQWNKSEITQNHKAENSRPVSLLPVLSKIMEKVMCKQIQQYFESNKLFSQSQYACRPDVSKKTTLEFMANEWYKELENNKLVGIVKLDFGDSFSLISHDLLLHKLKHYGFSDSANKLIKMYLFCKKQTVWHNGSFLEWRNTDCGVPQGSCLGPLLFCIFTNDLACAIKQSIVIMYEDDVTLYYSDHGHCELIHVLGVELQAVCDWINKNTMSLNTSKCKIMTIGNRKRISTGLSRYKIQNWNK